MNIYKRSRGAQRVATLTLSVYYCFIFFVLVYFFLALLFILSLFITNAHIQQKFKFIMLANVACLAQRLYCHEAECRTVAVGCLGAGIR